MIIHLKDINAMVKYSKENKDLLFKIIHKRISENIETDVDKVHIYEVYLTDYSVTIENVAYRKEWHTSLALALEFFEQEEDYETCCQIRDTLKKLTVH